MVDAFLKSGDGGSCYKKPQQYYAQDNHEVPNKITRILVIISDHGAQQLSKIAAGADIRVRQLHDPADYHDGNDKGQKCR